MTERAGHLPIWLGVLCGIAVAAVVTIVDPHPFSESARAARPVGGVALRTLVWAVIAFAAYWVLLRTPHARSALVSGRASSRDNC